MNANKIFHFTVSFCLIITLLIPSATVTAQETTGTISGTVYQAVEGKPIENIYVAFRGPDWSNWHATCTDTNGHFVITDIPFGVEGDVVAHPYSRMDEHPCNGPSDYVTEYWQEVPGDRYATKVVLSPELPAVNDITFTLEHGGSINGKMYEADGKTAIPNIHFVIGSNFGLLFDGCSDEVGSFHAANLPFGIEMGVQATVFDYCNGSLGYVQEFWQETPPWAEENSTRILLSASNPSEDIYFTLDPGGWISGTVRSNDNNPIADAQVCASPYDGEPWVRCTQTDASGSYRFDTLPIGDYRVDVGADGWQYEYYDDILNWDAATRVIVIASSTTSGIDFILEPPSRPWLCEPGTTISGYVLTAIGTTTEGSQVFFDDYNSGEALYYADSDENGYYSCTIPEGDYRVRAQSNYSNGYGPEYYNNTIFENATLIHVTATTELTGVDFSLDTPWGGFDHFTFNFNDPVLSDLAVRQAIAYGTDRARIIAAQENALQLDSYLSPQHWAYAASGLPQYDYNPGLAADLLTDAGWIVNENDGVREKNGIRLHFTYLFRDNALPRYITADIFAENMAAIGIEVEVLPIPQTEFNPRVYTDHDFGIAQFGWLGINSSGLDQGYGNFVGWTYYSADEWGVNPGSYCNPIADQLLEDALAFNTRAELLPFYQQHQILVMNDLAVFPLYMYDNADMDGDGIGDLSDNARFVFNPDQRDVDGDGIADVLDPCPADESNSCDPSGSAAAAIGTEGGSLTTANGNVSIQVPAGALADYISLSITDGGSGFLVNTDQGQIQAVVAVDIEPSGTEFATPITITFQWQDTDNDGIVDGTILSESELLISKDGVVIAGPCNSDANCDMDTNTFSVQVSSLSFFILGAPANRPPVAEAGGPYTVAWGMPLTLDGSGSTDPNDNISTYEWDLDNDGEYDDASGIAPTVTFNQDGEHTISLRVTDAGGLSDTDTATVTVLPWTLSGFYRPVDMNGVFNIAKNGSTVPFKFEIFAGATELTDITAIKSFTYAPMACDASAVLDEIEMIATGGTLLRYDATTGQFIYNWKTPRTAGKCYRVTMTTLDGSSLVAYFKLK